MADVHHEGDRPRERLGAGRQRDDHLRRQPAGGDEVGRARLREALEVDLHPVDIDTDEPGIVDSKEEVRILRGKRPFPKMVYDLAPRALEHETFELIDKSYSDAARDASKVLKRELKAAERRSVSSEQAGERKRMRALETKEEREDRLAKAREEKEERKGEAATTAADAAKDGEDAGEGEGAKEGDAAKEGQNAKKADEATEGEADATPRKRWKRRRSASETG